MTFEEIKYQIHGYRDAGKKLFLTSSFQTHSIPLLHMISRIDKQIPIVFINTGFHFPATLKFRDEVSKSLGLNVFDLRSEIPKSMQRGSDNRFYFTSDTDYCCHINKVAPLDTWLMTHDVWINGIRKDQSKTRSIMQTEQPAPHQTTRFHPILDWSNKMIWDYKKEYDLPDHPLTKEGYVSIGCEPCTKKPDLRNLERESRWYGQNKTECGLHTQLVEGKS